MQNSRSTTTAKSSLRGHRKRKQKKVTDSDGFEDKPEYYCPVWVKPFSNSKRRENGFGASCAKTERMLTVLR